MAKRKHSDLFFEKTYYPSNNPGSLTNPNRSWQPKYNLHFRFVYEEEGRPTKYEEINIPHNIIESFEWELPAPKGKLVIKDASGFFSSNILFRFLSPSAFSLVAEFNISVGRPDSFDKSNFAYDPWMRVRFANTPEIDYDKETGTLQFSTIFFYDDATMQLGKLVPTPDIAVDIKTNRKKSDIVPSNIESEIPLDIPYSAFSNIKEFIDYQLLSSVAVAIKDGEPNTDALDTLSNFKNYIPITPQVLIEDIRKFDPVAVEKYKAKQTPIRTYHYGKTHLRNVLDIDLGNSFSTVFTMFTSMRITSEKPLWPNEERKEIDVQKQKRTPARGSVCESFDKLKEALDPVLKATSSTLGDLATDVPNVVLKGENQVNLLDSSFKLQSYSSQVKTIEEAINLVILSKFSNFSASLLAPEKDKEDREGMTKKQLNDLPTEIEGSEAYKILAGRDLGKLEGNDLITNYDSYVKILKDKKFPLCIAYDPNGADSDKVKQLERHTKKDKTADDYLAYTSLPFFLTTIINPPKDSTQELFFTKKDADSVSSEEYNVKALSEFQQIIIPNRHHYFFGTYISNYNFTDLTSKLRSSNLKDIDSWYGGKCAFVQYFIDDEFDSRNNLRKSELLNIDFPLQDKKTFVNFRTTFTDKSFDKAKMELYDLFFFDNVLKKIKDIVDKASKKFPNSFISFQKEVEAQLNNFIFSTGEGSPNHDKKYYNKSTEPYVHILPNFEGKYLIDLMVDKGLGAIANKITNIPDYLDRMINKQMAMFNEWLVIRRLFLLLLSYQKIAKLIPINHAVPQLLLNDLMISAAFRTGKDRELMGWHNIIKVDPKKEGAIQVYASKFKDYSNFNCFIVVENNGQEGKLDFDPRAGEWILDTEVSTKVYIRSTRAIDPPPDIDITELVLPKGKAKIAKTQKSGNPIEFDKLINSFLASLVNNTPMTMTITVLGDSIYNIGDFKIFEDIVDMRVYELEKLNYDYFTSTGLKGSATPLGAVSNLNVATKWNGDIHRRNLDYVLSTLFSGKYAVQGVKHQYDKGKWTTQLRLMRYFEDDKSKKNAPPEIFTFDKYVYGYDLKDKARINFKGTPYAKMISKEREEVMVEITENYQSSNERVYIVWDSVFLYLFQKHTQADYPLRKFFVGEKTINIPLSDQSLLPGITADQIPTITNFLKNVKDADIEEVDKFRRICLSLNYPLTIGETAYPVPTTDSKKVVENFLPILELFRLEDRTLKHYLYVLKEEIKTGDKTKKDLIMDVYDFLVKYKIEDGYLLTNEKFVEIANKYFTQDAAVKTLNMALQSFFLPSIVQDVAPAAYQILRDYCGGMAFMDKVFPKINELRKNNNLQRDDGRDENWFENSSILHRLNYIMEALINLEIEYESNTMGNRIQLYTLHYRLSSEGSNNQHFFFIEIDPLYRKQILRQLV